MADDPAVRLTYGELEQRSRSLSGYWTEQGLRAGDHVAILMDNHVDYAVAAWAAQRSGCYYTPVNWHLQPDEVAYIVADCQARFLVTRAPLIELARSALSQLPRSPTVIYAGGGTAPSDWLELETIVEDERWADRSADVEGTTMPYSSGTTGLPKGILFDPDPRPLGQPGSTLLARNNYEVDADTVGLIPAPLYHAAPLASLIQYSRYGGRSVLMPRFDPELLLRTIQDQRVTHVQMVPTMFVRLLRLPESVRHKYDLTSLRYVIHAAAPCPVEVKRAIIEWFGPIVHEYYSGSEAVGQTRIDTAEWLAHPGSVGKTSAGAIHILNSSGRQLPPGEPGAVYFEASSGFKYNGDAHKTSQVYDSHGWATMGDLGYVDSDGYLYLTGRSGDTIISGGVNIYPREVEDALIADSRIADVAVVGVSDEEFGQRVVGLVCLESGVAATDRLAADLIAQCRRRLAHFKCPRDIEFVQQLPRTPTGKLQRHRLRVAGRSAL
jgi:acyl-CoA synthetase (AMP-forming)/AMP-acid ligase II